MRLLITGIAGFIGFHTAKNFLSNGHTIIGIDNLNNYYDPKLKLDRLSLLGINKENGLWHSKDKKIKFYDFDIACKSNWDLFLDEKFDLIIHLAAQAGVRYSVDMPNEYINSNIIGFQNVLDFCVFSKNNKLIYASSSSIYGLKGSQPFSENEMNIEPESFYGVTKLQNEYAAKVYFKTKGLSSIGLRFFTVYGPWGRPDMAPMLFTKAAFENASINIYSWETQKRDFTYIDDIILGIENISTYILSSSIGASIFNIGRGEPVLLKDFVELLEKKIKKQIAKRHLPRQVGDVDVTFADVSKLFNITGYSPKVSLEQGLDNFIKWYIDYYKHKID